MCPTLLNLLTFGDAQDLDVVNSHYFEIKEGAMTVKQNDIHYYDNSNKNNTLNLKQSVHVTVSVMTLNVLHFY